MSENLHDIDDIFKKAIERHEETPSSGVWEAIDKNLDKRKVVFLSGKYNRLRWVAAALLLFSFGMGMYLWQIKLKNNELVKQIISVDTNSMVTISKENLQKDNQEAINNSKENTRLNDDGDEKREAKNNGKIVPDNNLKDVADNRGKGSSKKYNSSNRVKINTTPGSSQINNETNQDIIETDKDISPQNFTTQIPFAVTTLPLFNNYDQIGSLHHFTYNPNRVVNDNPVALKSVNQNKKGKKNTLPSSKTSLLTGKVFFSPEFVATNVEDGHPRFREDNRHDIKNNEKTRSSTSYGILLDRTVGKRMILESGVSLFTRVTDINTKTAFARPDDRGNVNFRLSCSAGSAFIPLKSGTTPMQGDSTKIMSAKNTLQYVNIPFVIKYRIGKGKLTFNPGIGISANILSRGKVETVLATSTGAESSSSNNIEGLQSTYFNGQFNLGAEYYIGNKIALNFTPVIKLALSSINKDAPVKTNINTFGLAAGISVKL